MSVDVRGGAGVGPSGTAAGDGTIQDAADDRDRTPDFHAVFDALPGCYLVVRPDAPRFTIVAASDAYLAATMTRRDTTLGRPLFEAFADDNPENPAPSGVANLRASLEAVLRTRAPHAMAVQRYDLQRPDGTWEVRHWAPRNTAVLGADGGVRYLIHQVEDVTARVQERAATVAAERREAELRAVVESMSDAVYIGTAEGITLANPAALDQLGFATREELNRGVATLAEEIRTRDAGTGERIPVEREAFSRALGGERVVQDVLVRHRVTGEDRVVRCAAAPVVVEGRVVAAVAVNSDVTEVRRAAAEREHLLAELGAERERLQAVVRHMPAPLALHLGAEHRYALVNDAYRQVSGAHRALEGRTPRELFPEVAASGVFETLDRVYATGEPWDSPEVLLPFDREGTGRVRDTWFRVRLAPVRDGEGRVVGILNFSLEVTEQVAARRAVEANARALSAKTAELEESQERLRLALDAAGMAMWDFDPTTNTTIRSDHHDRIYGHDAPLAVWNFDVYLAHVHPDDRASVADRFARALRDEAEWRVESRVLRPDGVVRWVATHGTVFRDPDGTPNRVIGIISDVTARREAQAERERLVAALETERERLATFIRLTPAPVALHLGPEHRFAILSDAFRQVSGGRDLTGMTPREAYPEVVGHGILERFDEVFATGRPWISRETHARFDRRGSGVEDAWIDIRYEPVRDPQGHVIGVLNFSVDVTEQVRARQAVERHLHASEAARARGERLQRLAVALARAATPDEVARVTLAEGLTALGASVSYFYGPGADGRLETLATHGVAREVVEAYGAIPLDVSVPGTDAVRAGTPIWVERDAEFRARWPHLVGSRGPAEGGAIVALPVPVDGAAGALVMAFPEERVFDAEDRANLEAVAALAGQALERARLFHAEGVAREAAEEARRAAEVANRSKSEFLAVMSHELRTPLNAIGGYAELIELGIHGPVTPQQRTALERIQRSQRHLLGLIAGVLDYSRVEAGAITYRLADVPVAEAVAEAETLVAPQLRAKGLGYAWSGAPADAVRPGRPREAAAGPAEPAGQRGEVHRRAGRGAGTHRGHLHDGRPCRRRVRRG